MGTRWAEHLRNWPLPPSPFDLDPSKTALIVVDVQRHAADPEVGVAPLLKEHYPEIAEYYYGRLERTTIPAIKRLLGFFRAHELKVVFLCVGPWLEDRSDLTDRQRRRETNISAATGHQILYHHGHSVHEIIPELGPQAGELLLHKNSVSAFASTGIDLILRNFGIEYLLFTGLATQACVETTARDATDRGYYSVLVDDACITFTQAAHDAALLSFATTYGRVDDSASLIAELEAALSRTWAATASD